MLAQPLISGLCQPLADGLVWRSIPGTKFRMLVLTISGTETAITLSISGTETAITI